MTTTADSLGPAICGIAVSRHWDDVVTGAADGVRHLGAGGLSIGLLADGSVRTWNRGFGPVTSQRYATIPADAALPGPACLRSGEPLLLRDHAETLRLFPAAAPIHEGTPYEGAACFPLREASGPFGYVAVHFPGPHEPTELDRSLFVVLATVVAGAVLRLRTHRTTEDCARLQEEVEGLQEALRSRAVIEQAKGMLAERLGLDPESCWAVLRRLSNESQRRLREIAADVVAGREVAGLPGRRRPRGR